MEPDEQTPLGPKKLGQKTNQSKLLMENVKNTCSQMILRAFRGTVGGAALDVNQE